MVNNLKVMKDEVKKLEECIKNFDNIDIDKLKNDKEYKIKIHTPIIEQLQKINECFLQNVIIKINRLKIYPVEVEIYYYKQGVFEDECCHRNDLQKNNFGKLYFHRELNRKTKRRCEEKEALIDTSYYGGVDVCVSDSEDYYLSILIRSAYIKNRNNKENEFKSGIHRIVNIITDELENLLESGFINSFECKIYEDKGEKCKFLIARGIEVKCKNRKRIKNKQYFKDGYELNTYIDNESITSKIVKPK
jgi:hypothetical protein